MSEENTTLREQHDELLEALASLVLKIERGEACGTPIHPRGHPDCCWLKEGGYPSEYRHARFILEKALAREFRKWESGQ